MPAPTKATKPSVNLGDSDMSQEMQDILAMQALAARHNIGELIWVSWNSHHWTPKDRKKKQGRSSSPWAGAHLYTLTAKGARFLLKERVLENWWESHMGTALKHFLMKYQKCGESRGFGACYIYPPIGHYFPHMTTTNQWKRVLISHWDEPWTQGGTRRNPEDPEHVDRSLCWITETGPPEVVVNFRPDDDPTKWWCTRAAANFPEDLIGVQPWHIYPLLDKDIGISSRPRPHILGGPGAIRKSADLAVAK